MQYQPKEERPPHVTFHREAVKDKVASMAAGRAVYKDVDFVTLVPIGTKGDSVVHEVESWFQQLSSRVEAGKFPPKWFEDFKGAYDFWKRGEEPPVNGLSVKNWSIATPAEVRTMLDTNIFSVEDMAQAPEDAIRRLGMGGRALQQKAQAFLAQADGGKVAEEIAALKHENEVLRGRNQSLEEQVKALRAMLPSPVVAEQPAPRGWLNEDDDAA